MLGDIYVGMAQNAGVVAIVTDGAVRDLPGIAKAGNTIPAWLEERKQSRGVRYIN